MPKLKVTLDEIRQLERLYQRQIPCDFMDENQHMNVQYYVTLIECGIKAVYEKVGMGAIYDEADQYGNFALEQHFRYYAEVLEGDEVSVFMRLIGLSPKRTHMVGFLINDSRAQLAAIVEIVNMNVDMSLRRGSPFPPEMIAALEQVLKQHSHLAWEAPVCGVMRA